MAYELKPWKQANCSFSLRVLSVSDRTPFSQEINERDGEGGALNADYRVVEAIARVTNKLGMRGLVYGQHFVFKTADRNEITFDFCDKNAKERARELFRPHAGPGFMEG